MKEYIAVIQAGGQGSRMREITHDQIPKPMIKIDDKPIIQWQIEEIKKFGINKIIIIIGYLGQQIRNFFGDGEKFGVNIQYIEEREPLGSAGALYFLKEKKIRQDFIYIYGDLIFKIDWIRFVRFFEESGSLIALLAHPNSHPYDSDLLIVDKKNKVNKICKKNVSRNFWYDNIVNSGISICSNYILEDIRNPGKIDYERDILEKYVEQYKVSAYRTTEFVKDVGTPERLKNVKKLLKQGVLEQKCLLNKQKCIFLDRDGTLNVFKGFLNQADQLELEQGVGEAVRKMNDAGFLVIVVTNQPVVARGMCNMDDIDLIHRKLQTLLGKEGAYIDEICFCPHHPDRGFENENIEYKVLCSCRKPLTGMLDQMVQKYNIDKESSYMIGDSTVDIQTGINAGIKTILLNTGQAGKDEKYDVKADLNANTLLDAVKMITT